MKWLRRLFCRHSSIVFLRNIHGDEINAWSVRRVYRSLWLCERCGGLVARPELVEVTTV